MDLDKAEKYETDRTDRADRARRTKGATDFIIKYKVYILVVIVVVIIIIASNSSYYRTVTNLYYSLMKIPRLVMIVATGLSIFGLSNVIDVPSFFNHTRVQKHTMKVQLPDENGKRLVSDTTKKFVAAKQKWTCGMCNKMLDETFEIDHVVPLYKGGSNEIDNLMALDPICHRKKTNADRLNLASSVFNL